MQDLRLIVTAVAVRNLINGVIYLVLLTWTVPVLHKLYARCFSFLNGKIELFALKTVTNYQ